MSLIVDPHVVELIDVVAIPGVEDWSRWVALPGEVIDTWSGDQVRTVLDLLASLPASEARRCFLPRYGIRLRAAETIVAEVAFCFECHLARAFPSGHTPRLPEWFTFDGESAPAQQLLELFRSPGG